MNLERGGVMNTRIYTGLSHRSVIPYIQCGSMEYLLISFVQSSYGGTTSLGSRLFSFVQLGLRV
jgi:hypothetical protein